FAQRHPEKNGVVLERNRIRHSIVAFHLDLLGGVLDGGHLARYDFGWRRRRLRVRSHGGKARQDSPDLHLQSFGAPSKPAVTPELSRIVNSKPLKSLDGLPQSSVRANHKFVVHAGHALDLLGEFLGLDLLFVVSYLAGQSYSALNDVD